MPTRNRLYLFLILLLSAFPLFSQAQREPVLKQIDLPHPYYFREMYLPQLTTGPSAVAWAPDSRSVVYSMAGSLWRQKLDSATAEQLTAGAGYDYQPDCSPDGRWVVYASYFKDAVELWALDLETSRRSSSPCGGAVNVEPRFSPDGKRIAFVSTSFNGTLSHFCGRVQRRGTEGRPALDRRELAAPCLAITTASLIMRSVPRGRRMERKFFSFPIAGTFTAPAASGA